MVEQENLLDLLGFIFEAPAVHQSDWDGQVGYTIVTAIVKCCYVQWLNVIPANLGVANWRLVTSELTHVYSLCSDTHLLGVVEIIIEVFMSLKDQANNDNDGYSKAHCTVITRGLFYRLLNFISITVDFLTSCAFQEMSLLHTLLLQSIFQKAKLVSSQ